MTDNHRQKLFNWLCSVSLVLTFAALAPLYFWFVDLPRRLDQNVSMIISDIAGLLGESLSIYPLLFPVILFWHFWDFVQCNTITGHWRHLSDYRSFAMIIVAVALLMMLLTTGAFTINSCDGMERVFQFECLMSPPDWLIFPFWAAICFALILCIAKALVSIISILTRAS